MEKVRENLHCLFERVVEQGPVRKKSGISKKKKALCKRQ